MAQRRAHILGTGRRLPDRVVTNADIAARVPTTDEWIRKHLGIVERRFAADDEQTSDLAAAAARRALTSACVDAADVEAIVVALGNGDVSSPATACYVQEKIGAFHAVAFDLRAACAGFTVALDLAKDMIEAGARRHVLVIGADVASRTKVDWRDRTTPAIFADGAGAALVGPSPSAERGILAGKLRSDGRGKDVVVMHGGGSLAPFTAETLERGDQFIRMDGKGVWEWASRELPAVIRQVVADAGLTLDEVDLLVTHQASLRLLQAVVAELGLGEDKVHTTIERFGNTLSASLPITLDEAVELGKIKPGSIVVLAAIGAGMTWGAHVLRW